LAPCCFVVVSRRLLDAALAQIPDPHRHGTPVQIRSDTAGCTHGFLAHIRSLREHGVNTFFSVGFPATEAVRDAIRVATAGIPALEADGGLRDGAGLSGGCRGVPGAVSGHADFERVGDGAAALACG
jgi:hypothetical protein